MSTSLKMRSISRMRSADAVRLEVAHGGDHLPLAEDGGLALLDLADEEVGPTAAGQLVAGRGGSAVRIRPSASIGELAARLA